MRKLKLFLLLAVAAGSLFSLTACKDDGDNNNSATQPSSNSNAALVGTWIGSYDGATFTITFSADGRFVETYSYQAEDETYSGTYTYDGLMLTLRYDDGDVDRYPIVVTGNTFSMDEIVYTKQTAGKDDDDNKSNSSIVGTWECRDAYGYDRYTFTDKGSYTNIMEEYGKGSAYEEFGTYTYDGQYLKLQDPEEGYYDIYRVTVSGNKMTWYYDEGESDVYIRQ